VNRVEVVREYLKCLASCDGDGAAALFAETGVMDDGDGVHRVGRAAVKKLIDSIPSSIKVNAPQHLIDEGARVVAYGELWAPRFADKTIKLRWVFHFDGDKITHLGNSYVTVFGKPG
jgi:hypothetical protein